MEAKEIAGTIDHTILSADATVEDIKEKCQEAIKYQFASVCINPNYVVLAAEELKGSSVKVCTVIGFPLGNTLSEVKAYEAKQAVENGAQEVDMVINLGALKSGAWDLVKEDIKAVVKAAGQAIIKVIIETCYLTEDEKKKACQTAKEAGADFVKTSTGFGTGGATASDVRLMREVVGQDMRVKASGGIRNKEAVEKMIEAGATRIGASSGVKIIRGQEAISDY
ncbi:deoxyribose-phosphate aldolase [Halobacteroides halobius DSM 5150]|uniref:Deoxyribose-phosphate aldolase n=1 Tax=Halobacteroides halobius (strain ATCC 35273 / DSM 5150 / MD-1) TaxID=748449 RepID=L0KAE1_HALHC|nr:deoxyribose-phosphate aldolase [Halobacteroides halobius]AGB41510.1 deoxyribose-phosphate aldolase [Halobacteroides halobius DSM 5150]